MSVRASSCIIAVALAAAVATTTTSCIGEAATDPTPVTPSSTWEVADPGTPAPAPTVLEAPDLEPVSPADTSVAPRVVDSDSEGQLVEVTATSDGDSDILAFRFEGGAVPGYDIRYVDRLETGDGDVMLLGGSAVQTVTFTHTTPGDGRQIPEGVVTNEDYDLPVIRQVLLATNVGGTVMFGVGTSGLAEFAVTADAGSLVVTFPHD